MLGIITRGHFAVCDPNHNPATPSQNGTSFRDARLRTICALWTLEKLSRSEQSPVARMDYLLFPAMPHRMSPMITSMVRGGIEGRNRILERLEVEAGWPGPGPMGSRGRRHGLVE